MYWFLDETPEETPELGGYSYGLLGEGELLSKGAVELDNLRELDLIIQEAEDIFLKQDEETEDDREKIKK